MPEPLPVHVRPAGRGDAPEIRAIYAPLVTGSAVSFEEEVPSTGAIARRMVAAPLLPWLVAEAGGQVAGYAYAGRYRSRPAYRWSAECSVYVAASFRRRGVGAALYRELIAAVRSLGYVSLFAGIALPNPASVALHEALGFRPAGVHRAAGYKLGRWHDVGWWSLTLPAALPDSPAPPRTWGG